MRDYAAMVARLRKVEGFDKPSDYEVADAIEELLAKASRADASERLLEKMRAAQKAYMANRSAPVDIRESYGLAVAAVAKEIDAFLATTTEEIGS